MKKSALSQAGFLFYPLPVLPIYPRSLEENTSFAKAEKPLKTYYKKSSLSHYNKSSGKIRLPHYRTAVSLSRCTVSLILRMA